MGAAGRGLLGDSGSRQEQGFQVGAVVKAGSPRRPEKCLQGV